MVRNVLFFVVFLLAFSSHEVAADSTVFYDGLGKVYGAAKLDRTLDNFNVKVTKTASEYFKSRDNIMGYISPRHIYDPENLPKSREVKEAAEQRMRKAYQEIIDTSKDYQAKFDRILQFLPEEKKEKAKEIWAAEKQAIAVQIKEFFALETRFLAGFDRVVDFLSDRAGGYHVLDETMVKFSGLGDYEYYKSMQEALIDLTRKQLLILKAMSVGRR